MLDLLRDIRTLLDDIHPDDQDAVYHKAYNAFTQLETAILESTVERLCIECNTRFTLTYHEVHWYKSGKNDEGEPFKMPKRCYTCRASRKRAKMAAKLMGSEAE